jgi:HlyD family secretion protein
MNAQRLLIVVLGLTALAVAVYLAFGLSRPPHRAFSGYIEGEPLYLAAPISGEVTTLAVARGQRVAPGELLFTVDPRSLTAQRDAATGQIAQATSAQDAAHATAAQLVAQAAAAQVNADQSDREARRQRALLQAGHGATAVQDAERAEAASQAAQAQWRAAERQAAAAAAQVKSAGGVVGQARAALADAEAKLDQTAPHAPVAARVEDVFFQTGEWAAANQPVVSLLPDERVRLRFFVPEREVARYRVGRRVSFACDACPAGLTAVINYVSPRAEFTPPVIYSLQSRDRLVFLVEALPVHPEGLTPGLPIDVAPLGP